MMERGVDEGEQLSRLLSLITQGISLAAKLLLIVYILQFCQTLLRSTFHTLKVLKMSKKT